ncbi:glycosyltransferase family 2 protein [Winogradskyella forsetii]|uniref:glycosyltransferase family 2 protein n=1 Tax=Winogradskyella forsetii TaxID=2686077 RepID=UPI0015BE196C|nr:glycosyltransferase [Winogradskyella forsetii]
MKNPKVSVCVLTYNQENFIKKCLESILRQQTNFDFDIVIGEDCSIDNTARVVEKLSIIYKKINLLDNKINLGPFPNFIRTLKACKGKYIAFCEGDDYWIDERKLQKQVDFLEEHPEYGGVSTNNRWFFENENTYKNSILNEGEITFETLSESNQINSQTILFKKELIKELDWMKTLKIGDWPLHLLVSSQQPYYRLPEITTVYRVHSGGVHSLLKEEIKLRYRLEVLIAVLEHVELTDERKDLLKESIRNTLKKLIAHRPDDINSMRQKYYDFGGTFLNKSLLKSYIKWHIPNFL